MRTTVFLLVSAIVSLGAGEAAAHGAGVPVLPSEVLTDWHPDLIPLLLICVTGIVYAFARMAQLLSEGTSGVLSHGKAVAFYGGLILLGIALASPLESLAGTLLSAHMVQHVILITAAPLFIVVSRADVVFFRLLSPRARRAVGRASNRGPFGFLLRPVPSALVHGGTMLVWHAPPLFDAALTNDLVHDLEHLTFVITALWFWFSVAHAVRSSSRRLAGGIAILVTLIFGGALGALLTLAPRQLYAYQSPPEAWGLSPLADQQLAGLLMWVPAGAVYLLAGMVLAFAMLGEARDEDAPEVPAAR